MLMAGAPAYAIEFGSPVNCPEQGCIVAQYVDLDPESSAYDYRCGDQTYPGHKGTDITVVDFSRYEMPVDVVAAADGIVLRTRDGMDDVNVTTIDMATISGREVGNGVIVEHADGWETIYAHLRKGSVTVQPGDRVVAGDKLGEIGISGLAEYHHVHFEVLRGDEIIDPFLGAAAPATCGSVPDPLWNDEALPALAYRPAGALNAGFAGTIPNEVDARDGEYYDGQISADAEVLVFWADIIGVQLGDRLIYRIIAPDGTLLVEHAEILDRDRASIFQYVGKRRSESPWPTGTFRGEFALWRGDGVAPILQFFRDIAVR